jgi:hypothetical protein
MGDVEQKHIRVRVHRLCQRADHGDMRGQNHAGGVGEQGGAQIGDGLLLPLDDGMRPERDTDYDYN